MNADRDFAANTHILRHGGRLLATVEAGTLPYELTGELDTLGPCDFRGSLPGGFAAHTRLDPRTGELHAIAYSPALDYVQHITIDGDGQVTRTTSISLPDRPMMHDLALTKKYVVFLNLPVTFSLAAASAGTRMPYTWNPDRQARVGLLPRDGSASDVRWLEVDPCWVLPRAQRLRRRRLGSGGRYPVRGSVRRVDDERARPAHAGPVDAGPRGRQGHPQRARRPDAGVPARR